MRYKYNLLTTFKAKPCDRTREYVECLRRNIDNPFIKKVFLFLETEDIAVEFKDLLPQVEVVSCKMRPNYGEMFELANNETGRAIIANGDIYFDKSLRALNRYDLKGVFIHLTRTECSPSQHPDFHKRKVGAGDAWIFDTPIKVFAKNVSLGIDFCDHVIADLAEKFGYNLQNPASSIHAWHLHRKRNRRTFVARAPSRANLREHYPWIGKKIVTVAFSHLSELPKLKKPLSPIGGKGHGPVIPHDK